MEKSISQPNELLRWLHSSQEERVAADLSLLPNAHPDEIEAWTGKLLKSEDLFSTLSEMGWADAQKLGLPGDLVLVKITSCADPLCPPIAAALLLRQVEHRLCYLMCSSETGLHDAIQVASISEPLGVSDLLALLEQHQWLRADLSLDALPIKTKHSHFGATVDEEFHLVEAGSIYPELSHAFRMWRDRYRRLNCAG